MSRDAHSPAEPAPRDHGLAGLGLIMQLGGAVFLACAGIEVLRHLWSTLTDNRGGWADWFAFKVIYAPVILRSALHVRAGRALTRRSGPARLYPTYTYIAVAFAQTALSLESLHGAMGRGGDGQWIHYLVAALVLLAWPTTLLAMLIHPRLRRAVAQVPSPATGGVPGPLFVVLGLTGALAALFTIYAVLGLGDPVLLVPPTERFLLAYACALLMTRSILQAIAGARVMSGADDQRTDRAMARYVWFGLLSSVLAGASLILAHLVEQQYGDRWSWNLQIYGMEAWTMALLLFCWPIVVRPAVAARRSSLARSPDTGLASLGWLLLAAGVFQLVLAVPDMLHPEDAFTMVDHSLRYVNSYELSAVLQDPRWPWWIAAMTPVQLWAAVELIHATRRQRLAATLYGALSSAITLYLFWPHMLWLSETLGHAMPLHTRAICLYQAAFWLIVPLVTLIFANRKLPAPGTPRAD